MKLPHHLLRTYRRYKEDEQDLLYWIESTAAESGYKPAAGEVKPKAYKRNVPPQSSTEQQLNGRRATRYGNRSKKEEPTISILEILPLVLTIARCSRIVSVPARVAELFTRVLDLRTSCVKWFRQNTHQNDTQTRQRNAEHAYPLAVLQSALYILKSKLPSKSCLATAKITLSEIPDLVSEGNGTVVFSKDFERTTPASDPENAAYDITLPPLSQSRRVNEHQKMQDEFNVAKYCLLRDVQEIEDFMILELVRYTLDQANAEILPLLLNAAIDIVAKMDALIYERFDRAKFEKGFWQTISHSDADGMLQSPLLRMECLVRVQLAKVEDNSPKRIFQQYTEFFDPETKYFGTTNVEQANLERIFINNILHLKVIQSSGDYAPVDRTLSLIRELFHEGCKDKIDVIPAAVVFGIRIALLAVLLLGDRAALPLKRLLVTAPTLTALVATQNKLWDSTRYQSQRVEDIWNKVQPEETLARRMFLSRPPFIRTSADALPLQLTFAWSECLMHMDYAIRSVQVMETSNIVKVLAHLWNLLQEEKHLNSDWPDMQYLMRALGEKYLFQDTRPTIARAGGSVLRSRLRYGIGLTVNCPSRPLNAFGGFHPTISYRGTYDQICFPVYGLLKVRREGIAGSTCRVEDLELVINAAVVPRILGIRPKHIRLNLEGKIEERHKAWKLYDEGPGLSPLELLALVKRGLSREFLVMKFDYLNFERAILQLAESVLQIMDGLPIPAYVRNAPDAYEQLQWVALQMIAMSTDSPQFTHLATILKEWLATYGHIGVKGLNMLEQLPVDPKTQLSSLRPEVLEMVQGIVKIRGLREDVFYEAQLDVNLIAVTENIDDIIAHKWAAHKAKKRRNQPMSRPESVPRKQGLSRDGLAKQNSASRSRRRVEQEYA